MNWLNQCLEALNVNLSNEPARQSSDQLKPYIDALKAKTDEMKEKMGCLLRRSGFEDILKHTAPPYAHTLNDSESKVESKVPEPREQRNKGHIEENENKTISKNYSKTNFKNSEKVELVKYNIIMNNFPAINGEIRLAQDTSKEDLQEAILEDIGFSITTKIGKGATITNNEDKVFTGFNSFASLFAR